MAVRVLHMSFQFQLPRSVTGIDLDDAAIERFEERRVGIGWVGMA